jgi:hypothetical protein
VNDDEIRDRLRAMGTEPIDEPTHAAHMRRMAAGGAVAEPRRRGMVWAGIAAAAVVGFLAGSTGLALADALPDPAQEVAHDVLRVVQVDVPQGKEGKHGPCMSQAAKIKDKDAKKAAKEACPKGGKDESGDESGDETGEVTGTHEQGPPPANDPCHGRPPWAGPMSKEQRDAAKASASRANCPKDAEDTDESEDESADESKDESTDVADAATTTESTVATTTTTAPTAPAAPTTTSQPAQP